MKASDLTMDQLAEAVAQYGDTEAFQNGMRKGRAAAKKKLRADRMKAAQLKAFGVKG